MPNWTSNVIRIDGEETDIRAFLEAVKWQDEIFDFNRIVPMPELLKHTGSGCRTINGEPVTAWYVIDDQEPLPGDAGVRRFTPEEEAALAQIGHSNWLSWSIANWGTKWNACHAELIECVFTEPCYAKITFATAYSVPLPVFHKMIEMFPELSFKCSWQDEGESYCYSLESCADETA